MNFLKQTSLTDHSDRIILYFTLDNKSSNKYSHQAMGYLAKQIEYYFPTFLLTILRL